MAREIKFRAWCNGTNRMASWELILRECDRFSFLNNHDWEFMQFTGLLDKNGKEIYEGDILKEYWEPCGDDAEVCGEYIGEVFYEDAGYWTRSKNHHHSITKTCDSYEVIGNIYEHSHLLNQEELKQ